MKQPATDDCAGGRWSQFWFTPIDPLSLNIFRVVTGLIALAWLVALGSSADAFFGLNGWFDRQAFADVASQLPDASQSFGWSPLYILGQGTTGLWVAYGISLGIVAAYTLGLWPRFLGVATWVVVASFSESPAAEVDDVLLLNIATFYLAVGYGFMGLRDGWRSSRRVGPILGWKENRPSIAANLALRLFQVHFAIVIVVSGLHKLQFGDWWAGVALWYPLHPPLETTAAVARAHAGNGENYLRMLSIAAYAILTWQLSFPFFAWRQSMRWLLIGGGVALGATYIWLFDMAVYGPMVMAGCLSYVTSENWRQLAATIRRATTISSARMPLPQN